MHIHNKRKGISSVVAAIIILPLVIGVLTYSIYTLRTEYVTYSNMLAGQAYKALSKTEALLGTIRKNSTSVKLTIDNNGLSTSTIKLAYLHVRFTGGGKLDFVVNLSASNYTPASPISAINITGNKIPGEGLRIPPGESASIVVSFTNTVETATAGAITEYGTYIEFKPPQIGPASSIATTLVMFTVPSLTDLQTRSDVSVVDSNETLAPGSPSDPGAGMTLASGDSGLWCLYDELDNANITGDEDYSVLAVGFSGGWSLTREGPPIYSILLTTDYNYYSDITIASDNTSINIGELLENYKGVRLVIYGYQGDISLYDANSGSNLDNNGNPANVIGIRLYGQYAGTSWVKLNGTADKVYVYVRNDTCGNSENVSYTPYTILGDFDNNGNSELLFITEDGFFQDSYWIPGDDTDRWGSYIVDLNDYSSEPITFYFKGYPIDSNKYAAVQVTIRYYFHDDAPGDENEIDYDRWILRIGFYDPDNKTLTSYYELRYQYLTKLEDTYPPNWDYRIDTIQLLVPQTGKTYYIGLQFRDPYAATSTDDDADLMLGVEYLSLILMENS